MYTMYTMYTLTYIDIIDIYISIKLKENYPIKICETIHLLWKIASTEETYVQIVNTYKEI